MSEGESKKARPSGQSFLIHLELVQMKCRKSRLRLIRIPLFQIPHA